MKTIITSLIALAFMAFPALSAVTCVPIDAMAVAIKEKGLQMPEDIGLVGFNNEPVVSLVTPEISSVEMPCFELGKAAAKLFIETMHHKENMNAVEQVLKPKLFIRASSQRIAPKKGGSK